MDVFAYVYRFLVLCFMYPGLIMYTEREKGEEGKRNNIKEGYKDQKDGESR